MGPVIFIWVLGLLVFAIGVCALYEKELESVLGFVGLIGGVFLLIMATFVIVPLELPSGLPKTGIKAGEYKVAFVYVAGENVNLGIEGVYDENERLYLYQFPKSAFDSGLMNTQAKKLVVVESGGFRKLVLE